MPKQNKSQLNIKIKPELKEIAQETAFDLGLTLTAFIVVALQDKIRKHKRE